jgi:hypothetical protein
MSAVPRLGSDPLSVFGQIVTGAQVEAALTATLQKWMRTYLRELERQDGYQEGALPMVRSWTVANDVVKFPEEQLPAVVVVSTGVAAQPRIDGDGVYTAVWDIAVSAICSAASREASNEFAKLYLAAATAILVQQIPADGLISGVDWAGLTYTEFPQMRMRMQAEAKAALLVTVTDVLSRFRGPLQPDDDPADLGTVQEVDIDALASRYGSGAPPDLMHLVKKEAP